MIAPSPPLTPSGLCLGSGHQDGVQAVVDGMGSVWDQCTDPHRHPRFETGQQEAVIAWNAPAAHLPEADPFLRRALRRVLSENSL